MADRDSQFRRLLDVYHPKVFRLALSYLRNETAAEDAAQEVFLRVWKNFGRFRADASPSTWIYAIARNYCLDQMKRRPMLELADQAITMKTPLVLDSELERAIRQLPADLARVLRLFYWEERSYQEVAELLDLPMGTVKSHLFRAKERLAAILDAPRMKEDAHGRTGS